MIEDMEGVLRRGLVTPMSFQGKITVRIAKAKPQVHPPEKRRWMAQQMAKLKHAGLTYPNPQAALFNVAMVLPKGEKMKLMADYRAIT